MIRRAVLALITLGACSERPADEAPAAATPAPVAAASPASPASTPAGAAVATRVTPPDRQTLLLAQAQFTYDTDATGKRVPRPGAAKLTLVTREGTGFRTQVLEDSESRVFHKALCRDLGEGPALLTVGASGAILKSWTVVDGAWRASPPLYQGSFGGKWDRLRDLETGDLDGDGRAELVLGTHDQGVILVLSGGAPRPTATQVYARPNTFIHEIELGDVMGTGRPQIYATPSEPNQANASQPGAILVLAPTGKGPLDFAPSYVDRLVGRHAKEILTADLDRDGRPELYAAVEAELAAGREAQPVEIRRYTYMKRAWRGEVIAKLERAVQSRVLLAADLTGSGPDLIVTTMKGGLFRLVRKAKGPFGVEPIDAESTGFEHAANAADLDGDGRPELYVSPDDQDELRRYTWDGSRFARETIAKLEKSDITWNIEPCAP